MENLGHFPCSGKLQVEKTSDGEVQTLGFGARATADITATIHEAKSFVKSTLQEVVSLLLKWTGSKEMGNGQKEEG